MIPVKPRMVIISMIVFMALNLAYLPFEKWDYKCYPFPLKPTQYIWLTNLIDIFFGRFGSILYMGILAFYYNPRLRDYIFIAFFFFFVWVVDFFLSYNNPLLHWRFIPTSFSFWAVVLLITWLWYDSYLHKKRQTWMK